MFYRVSLLFLILTVPIVFIDDTLLGLPLWAAVSLLFTLLFALFAVLAIEKEWRRLKGDRR